MSHRDPPDPYDRADDRAADCAADCAAWDAERRDAAQPDAASAPGSGDRSLARGAGEKGAAGGRAPERRQERRRDGRGGVGRRSGERAAGSATEQRPTGDRRRVRTLPEQRERWSEVGRWLRRHDLVDFRELLERLAQAAFGEGATVMPHLRRSRGRRYLVFVVDAACPEACTSYEEFLPLERAFWTAYGTLPKPDSPFVVAVRPARGWCRSEALMPLFAQLTAPEHVT